MYRWLSILPGSGSYPVQDPKIATFRMGKIQTILIALDLTVGFLVASTSLQAALTSTAVVSGSTTAVVAADPISYQGRLSDSGSPASGSYDFQFTLKDAASAGNTLGEAIKMTLSVQSGVFSASLPWSPGLFPGSARWIEVQVRPTPSSGSAVSESEAPYAVLERQRIQSTPYALRSLTSATVESVPVQSLPASVPLIGSEGKLDSGLLAADIARSSEVDSKVALLTKEDLGIKGSVKALEDANTARVAETASLTANLQNLQAKWTASQEAMDAKLAALTAENAALKKSVQVIGAPARSGWMVASLQAEDPELVSAGFSLVSSTPAASWVPTASVGAPSARSSSASVWTGQEWIIWGGSVASQTPVATGARYRPDTDTWSDLTSVDAPKARKGHTAVWTGSQMIVWGGFNENNLNTGGRFTPYPQSWSSMSTEDAPTARTGHRAVWTGKTMVIFGGRNSGGLLSDGGVYDPASDRWTALPTAGAPNARHLASVIWTTAPRNWRMAMPIPGRCCPLIHPANLLPGRPCQFWTRWQVDLAMPACGMVNDSSSGAGATVRVQCSPTVPSGIPPLRSGLTSKPPALRRPDSMPLQSGPATNWWCSVVLATKDRCPAGPPGVFLPGSGEPCHLRLAPAPAVEPCLPGLDPIC
jgi:hypothetical protein